MADYLEAAGLQTQLDALGFTIAGFGWTTCIGNSGPLKPEISAAVDDNDMTVVCMGVLPLQFDDGVSAQSLQLTGLEGH